MIEIQKLEQLEDDICLEIGEVVIDPNDCFGEYLVQLARILRRNRGVVQERVDNCQVVYNLCLVFFKFLTFHLKRLDYI